MTDSPQRRKGRPPEARRDSGPNAQPAQPQLTIGALADELGITTRAIRFYEARGLLAPDRKGVARTYTRRDRARLMLILRGKNLGFTLEDIKEYLELYDSDPKQLAQMQLLKSKIDTHIEALERKHADLERTLGELREIQSQVAESLAKAGKP